MTRTSAHGCNAACDQACGPCDCELSGDVAPDAERVIAAPKRTTEDAEAIARVRRWALFLAVVTFSALAALLGISDPRFTP